MSEKYELIKVTTADHIILNGLYKASDSRKSALILIHGFTSDFYSHEFYHSISRKLEEQGVATILAQTRGTGLHTEFIKDDGEGVFIGSYYEKIEEAHLDISAIIVYLKNEGYEQIILAGHSLGTIKVVRYLFEGKYNDLVSKLVLLAPFDKNVFMEMKGEGNWDKYLSVAQNKIASGKGKEIVPIPEFEDYPVTYETFVSWYNKSDLNLIWDFYRQDYVGKTISQIKLPVCVILGEKDEYTNYPKYQESPSSVLAILKSKIPNCEPHLIAGSPHAFKKHETELANIIAKFLA